ncbi:MAG: NFACT family protein [Desulfuromonadales bacterium]|nr:NFACT family protein [Desulfuromonadales bacterium]
MDSLLLHALTREVAACIEGSRIDRIIQTDAKTLVLRLWTGREKQQLCLQADAASRFFLTEQSFAAPATPPRFCQLLRARLRRLLTVVAEPFDRIVHFRCLGAEHKQYTLTFELLGTQPNLVLIDDETGLIVDLLRRNDGPRPLLPGKPYVAPEQGDYLPLTASAEPLATALADTDDDVAAMLSRRLYPMSKPMAQLIAAEVEAGADLAALLQSIQQRIDAVDLQPCRIKLDAKSVSLPFLPGAAYPLQSFERFDSISAMLEAGEGEEEENPQSLGEKMLMVIGRQERKLKKRIKQIEQDRARNAKPDEFKVKGELLLANLYQVKRGMESVEVDNYYDDPPSRLTLQLRSDLTPQQNVERCFQRYRKAQRSKEHHQRRLAETTAEQLLLGELRLALEEAQGPDDLFQVQGELETTGLLKKVKGALGKRPAPKVDDQLLRAETPGGYRLLWGKNSRTNDHISRRLTAADDLWLHANRMPGCHLVLKCEGRADDVPEADVLFAASLAAGYSKGKEAAKVEVMVAFGRDVKKPKGARAGLVTVDSYRSVMVKPARLNRDN